MLGSERPMASLIIFVSSPPEAPTSVPATTRMTLSSTKPSAATAKPVKLLSNEISTGVSAPPTGRTIPDPRARATTVRTIMNGRWGETTTITPRPTTPSPKTPLTTCWPG